MAATDVPAERHQRAQRLAVRCERTGRGGGEEEVQAAPSAVAVRDVCVTRPTRRKAFEDFLESSNVLRKFLKIGFKFNILARSVISVSLRISTLGQKN